MTPGSSSHLGHDAIRPDEFSRSLPLAFGLTSLFADMTYELAHVLLPVLLLSLGGTAVAAAQMESIAELSKIAGFLAGGRLARSPAREAWLVRIGYFVTVVATVLFGAAGAVWEIVLLKSLSWFGKGLRGPSRDALMANALPPSLHASAFATVKALDQTGGILGPLLALFLARFWAPSPILFAASLPAALCVISAILATQKASRIHEPASQPSPVPSGGLLAPELRATLARPEVWQSFFAGVLLRAGLLPATLLMFRFAGEGWDFSLTVAGFLLSSLATVATSTLVAKRPPSSPRHLLRISALLLPLSYLLLSPAPLRPSEYLVSLTLWGVGEALTMLGLKVRMAAVLPPPVRSRGLALFESVAGLAALALWPLTASLWSHGHTETAMLLVAACASIGAILLSWELTRPSRPQGQ